MSEFLKTLPTIYINLLSRTDRKEHIESELKKLGITNPTRFNAIKMENGALGCSMKIGRAHV